MLGFELLYFRLSQVFVVLHLTVWAQECHCRDTAARWQLVRTGFLFSPCSSRRRTRAIRLGSKQSYPLSYLDYKCSYSLLFIFVQHFTYSPFTMSPGFSIRTGESLQEAWSWVLRLFSLFRRSVFPVKIRIFPHSRPLWNMKIHCFYCFNLFLFHMSFTHFFLYDFHFNYLVFLNVSFWLIDLQFACLLYLV